MRSIKKLILGAVASVMISTSAMADYTFHSKARGGTRYGQKLLSTTRIP